MSPLNKKKLNVVRKKLDKLDLKLLELIKLRTNLVNEVIKLKQFKKDIVDKKRISVILTKKSVFLWSFTLNIFLEVKFL